MLGAALLLQWYSLLAAVNHKLLIQTTAVSQSVMVVTNYINASFLRAS